MSARVELSDAGGLHLHWSSEFDIRDGLAEFAELYGWGVDKEHVVPGWGRPDLYLTTGPVHLAVEVKTELSTASRCRKAIQQAAGYVVAMPEVTAVYLVAASINRDAMAPYDAAYGAVEVMTVDQFFSVLGGFIAGRQAREQRALRRYRRAEVEMEKRARALRALSLYEGSVLSPSTVAPPGDFSAAWVLDAFFGKQQT